MVRKLPLEEGFTGGQVFCTVTQGFSQFTCNFSWGLSQLKKNLFNWKLLLKQLNFVY